MVDSQRYKEQTHTHSTHLGEIGRKWLIRNDIGAKKDPEFGAESGLDIQKAAITLIIGRSRLGLENNPWHTLGLTR